jgi:hypothetical protein
LFFQNSENANYFTLDNEHTNAVRFEISIVCGVGLAVTFTCFCTYDRVLPMIKYQGGLNCLLGSRLNVNCLHVLDWLVRILNCSVYICQNCHLAQDFG